MGEKKAGNNKIFDQICKLVYVKRTTVGQARKKKRLRRSMMEGHHTTDTQLVNMRLQPAQEPEGIILSKASEHKITWGDLYTTSVSAGQVFDHNPALGMARIYLGSKGNFRQFYRKTNPVSCDVSTGHSTETNHHCAFALCSSQAATIGHQWRKMMHRQGIFIWRIK